MEASRPHALEQWHEFFLLCGTAAATLIGALFIVISLGPSIIAAENQTGVRAFISPNAGLLSMLYLWSTRAPRRWRENRLSKLDWVWYIAMPCCAYVLALAAGNERAS